MKLLGCCFKPKKTSSAQIVSSIDDLLIEIFLRLPLKPLVRFKLVSKHWDSVISDPKFTFLRNQNPNPAAGLIFPDPYRPSDEYVVFFNGLPIRTLKFITPWPCTILSSCNGLLLCKRNRAGIHDPNMGYYVCNPTTNKYFMLPQINPEGRMRNIVYLAFDPSKSPHYNVVCVRKLQLSPTLQNQLVVYSSQTGSWRECGEPFTAYVYLYCGVYWNGAIHWISFSKSGKSLYFNPNNDQMPREMPTPPILNGYPSASTHYYFGESCGHLHYIEEYKTAMELNVYELRRDYSEWFVKYKVDCSCIVDRLVLLLCTVVRGKKGEDSFLVTWNRGKLVRHNLVHKTFETICEIEGAESEQRISTLCADFLLQYIESLCSV